MSIIEAFGYTLAMQFEPSGQDFLYRKDNIGAPIRVTASERTRFVRTFGWLFLAHVAGLGAAIIIAAVITAQYFPAGGEPGGFVLMGGFMVAIVVILYLCVRWTMHAPARALAGRPPVGPPRTRADVARPHLAALSYGTIAGRAALIAAAAPVLAFESIPAAIAALLLAVVAFAAMALWKWKSDRSAGSS